MLLSDVDELVVPDPTVYKSGLSEYVRKFSEDKEKTSMRVNGYIVAHISNPDGDENKRIEPALDWWVGGWVW